MDRSLGEKVTHTDLSDEVRMDYNNPAKRVTRDGEDLEPDLPHIGEDAEDVFNKEPWEVTPKIRAEPKKKKFEKYMKYMPGIPLEAIKRTFKATTQLGRISACPSFTLRHRLKSPNPALSIPRRNEDVATDTIYGPRGVPAVDDGSTAASSSLEGSRCTDQSDHVDMRQPNM